MSCCLRAGLPPNAAAASWPGYPRLGLPLRGSAQPGGREL